MSVKALAVLLVLLLVAGTGVQAAWNVGGSFGTLSTGQTIGRGEMSVLAGLGIGDATTAFGGLRYGVANRLDGRVKLGLRDDGGTDAEFIFGADLMYQILTRHAEGGDPINLSLGGMFELWNSELFDVWEAGGFVVGSYPHRLGNGMWLSPYGRINVRVEDIDGGGPGGDASELELGLNAGGRLDVTNYFNVYAEIQIDGNDGLFLGVELYVR